MRGDPRWVDSFKSPVPAPSTVVSSASRWSQSYPWRHLAPGGGGTTQPLILTLAHSCNMLGCMKRNSQLSGVLHVLLHMAERESPMTSEVLAKAMDTNPVVIRRIMAGLRDQGYVRSEKGHGGGWSLARDLSKVTLRDVYIAIGGPPLLAIGNRTEAA